MVCLIYLSVSFTTSQSTQLLMSFLSFFILIIMNFLPSWKMVTWVKLVFWEAFSRWLFMSGTISFFLSLSVELFLVFFFLLKLSLSYKKSKCVEIVYHTQFLWKCQRFGFDKYTRLWKKMHPSFSFHNQVTQVLTSIRLQIKMHPSFSLHKYMTQVLTSIRLREKMHLSFSLHNQVTRLPVFYSILKSHLRRTDAMPCATWADGRTAGSQNVDTEVIGLRGLWPDGWGGGPAAC